MTADERRQVMDIAEVQVNRYFDHYLTDVFPQQMERQFGSHNADVGAHPVQFKVFSETTRRVDRVKWMVAGGSAVVGFVSGLIATHWSAIVKLVGGG